MANEAFVLRRFAAWIGRDIQIQHLRAERVEQWFYGPGGLMFDHNTRDGRVREPIQPSTHNFYRSRLKSFFEFCLKHGLIREDLLAQIEPMPEVVKQRQQPRPHVLLEMLERTDCPNGRAFMAVAINTGLRASEITSLLVGSVNLDEGSLYAHITKSSEYDRMPISSDLDAEIRRWLKIYAADIGRPLADDDYLFPARKGSVYVWKAAKDGTKVRTRTKPSWRPGQRLTHPERIVQSALARVGLPTDHEGVHTLRRAAARNFFDFLVADPNFGYDGALRTVSAFLHHKNVATTEHYLGLRSERERRDKMLRGRPFLTAMVDQSNVVEFPRSTSNN